MVADLFVVVLFMSLNARSDDYTESSPVQPMNELNDQFNMARDEITAESLQEFKISEADIVRTEVNYQKKWSQLTVYIVVSLAVIVGVIIVLICLWKDPMCCLFFTLCPCCILAYPCILWLSKKYQEPEKLMQTDVEKYMPGLFYTEDGLLKRYKPSQKEMELFADIGDIMETPEQNGRPMDCRNNTNNE